MDDLGLCDHIKFLGEWKGEAIRRAMEPSSARRGDF